MPDRAFPEITNYPQNGQRQEGTCWACGGDVTVFWHREYTGATAWSSNQYDAEAAERSSRGVIGFNADSYRHAHPAFNNFNSQEVIDSHVCAQCGNVRFPQPMEEHPVRWVGTDATCSACHCQIVDEQSRSPFDPAKWGHICYSCISCRMLFRDLPRQK